MNRLFKYMRIWFKYNMYAYLYGANLNWFKIFLAKMYLKFKYPNHPTLHKDKS